MQYSRGISGLIFSSASAFPHVKSVSKVLGQMWALLALGWVSQDFWDRHYYRIDTCNSPSSICFCDGMAILWRSVCSLWWEIILSPIVLIIQTVLGKCTAAAHAHDRSSMNNPSWRSIPTSWEIPKALCLSRKDVETPGIVIKPRMWILLFGTGRVMCCLFVDFIQSWMTIHEMTKFLPL